MDLLLVVGLGNPGVAYERTRHNVGFSVLRSLAAKRGLKFRKASHLLGEMAREPKAVLLLPLTFMNSSGDAVRRCAEYFQIAPSQILVVCDDVALPFGKLRMRERGSAGGHNGLKSIEEHLGSQDYPRLRIGVGAPSGEEVLADYVLGTFSAEEWTALPKVVEKAVHGVETWMTSGVMKAAQSLSVNEVLE